jgi:hypothetical protein
MLPGCAIGRIEITALEAALAVKTEEPEYECRFETRRRWLMQTAPMGFHRTQRVQGPFTVELTARR